MSTLNMSKDFRERLDKTKQDMFKILSGIQICKQRYRNSYGVSDSELVEIEVIARRIIDIIDGNDT